MLGGSLYSSPQSPFFLISPRAQGSVHIAYGDMEGNGESCGPGQPPVYCRAWCRLRGKLLSLVLLVSLGFGGRRKPPLSLATGPLSCGHCKPAAGGQVQPSSEIIELLEVKGPSPREPGQGRTALFDTHAAYGPRASAGPGSVDPQGQTDGNLTVSPSLQLWL